MLSPEGVVTSAARPTPTRRAAEDIQVLALVLLELAELGVKVRSNSFSVGEAACREDDRVGDMNRGAALQLA